MTRTKKQTHNGDERRADLGTVPAAARQQILAAPPRFGIGRRKQGGPPRDDADRRTTARNGRRRELPARQIPPEPRPAAPTRRHGRDAEYRLDVRACRRHGAAGLHPLAQLAERSRRRPRATGAHAQGTGFQRPRRRDHRDRRTQPQTLRRHGRSQRTQCLRAYRLAQDARRRLPPQARLPEREKRR